MEQYIIIGCGAAGMAAAERLRSVKPDASILSLIHILLFTKLVELLERRLRNSER